MIRASSRQGEALLEAAQMLSREPAAMQLRYLQTLTQVAGDRTSTVVFPVPTELLGSLLKTLQRKERLTADRKPSPNRPEEP
ncbi:hypothetical protein [Zoogloea sp.]|uniref:hypothetical protein n=1 Tax=Zoogloea sp. TaxID=49181 RepID=UPI0035B0F02E